MGVIQQLLVSSPVSGAASNSLQEFVAEFAMHRHGEDNSLYVQNADVATDIASQARARGLVVQRLYHFVVHLHELHDYPAYYLSVDVVEPLMVDGRPNLAILKAVEIAKDLESESIWITSSVGQFLQRTTAGVMTTPVERSKWRVITYMAELPGAVWVPRPILVSPNEFPAGTHVVQSDGRDCISDADALFVQQHGLCRVATVDTDAGRYLVRPRYLISPMLLEDMLTAGTGGLRDDVVPLIDKQTAATLEGGVPL